MVKSLPLYGLMAFASSHSCLASSGSYSRTSLPGTVSLQPSMTGDVKSFAGVRVPLKMTSVICSRLIAWEIAARRSLPSSSVWKPSSHSGIVSDWKIAAGWLTERSSRSVL